VGARAGDIVRAVIDARDAGYVEGELDLCYVGSLNYVQVHVLTDDGFVSVVPESIEVLRISGLSTEELADRWTVFDLDYAVAQGLVSPTQPRVGGSWADMVGRLDWLVAPLLQDGWQIIEKMQQRVEFGRDLVGYILEREGTTIDIELYDDGWIGGWDLADSDCDLDDDEDPPEPLIQDWWHLDDESDAGRLSLKDDFIAVGWLSPEGKS
jgi:hypothetical protein